MENSSHLPQTQCPLTLDGAMEYEITHGRLFNDPNIDWKKLRRTVSNRLSAQRSRIKTVNYTRDMETMVKDLEELIAVLKPQVESQKEKNNLLQLENDSLRKELEKCSNESRHLEMEIEEKRAEIKMLKGLEKSGLENKHAADSEAEEIPDLRFEPLKLKVSEYPSIHLYQICLQNQQKNPSPPVVLKMRTDSAIEQSGNEIKLIDEEEKKNLEYENVDQYFNFDALNAADAPHDVKLEENLSMA